MERRNFFAALLSGIAACFSLRGTRRDEPAARPLRLQTEHGCTSPHLKFQPARWRELKPGDVFIHHHHGSLYFVDKPADVNAPGEPIQALHCLCGYSGLHSPDGKYTVRFHHAPA